LRFEELSLRIPGDELRMRFHQRVTVLSGLEAPERRGLVESLLGSLTVGPARDTVLTYRDGHGQRVTISRAEDGTVTHTYDDGSVAPDLAGVLGLDAADLAAFIHVTESGVGFVAPNISLAEPPELGEARAALAQLSEDLDAALTAHKAVEAMREELVDIDERLREADEGESRRHYARMLADLERVRAEAAAVRTGDTGAMSDRRFIENARGTVRLAGRWQKVAEQLAAASERFGGRERLDPETLADAESMPVRVPAKLNQLVSAAHEAEQRRDQLATRLSSLATSRLPEPSHPAVVRLADADQEAVWALAHWPLRSPWRGRRDRPCGRS
jgi:hypothetical protein